MRHLKVHQSGDWWASREPNLTRLGWPSALDSLQAAASV